MTPIYILGIYIVAVSICGFVMMGLDKQKAIKGQWRTKESTLLGIAFIGGAIGIGAGMSHYRHKTKTLIFQVLVPLFLVLNIAMVYFCFKYFF